MPPAYDRQGYGNAFFFGDLNGDGTPEFHLRGSPGRLPWTSHLDLSAQWRPAWADHKPAFAADVFNLFHRQRTDGMFERGDDLPYRGPLAFSAARSVRLGALRLRAVTAHL